MARGTDNRPDFPDPDRPLYTPDVKAQKQVVARIARARKGNGKRARKVSKPEHASTPRITIARNLPMEQHRIIGRDALANALGITSPKAADKRVKEHPEKLDPWQVRQLCDLCGVTLEWLRGWEEVNAYGQYETGETVAAMYSYLSNEDRALVCDLLTRLLGADAARAIRHEQWIKDNREWLKRHPKEAKKIFDAIRKANEPALKSMYATIREFAKPALEPMRATLQAAAEPMRDIARAITDIYTAEEWGLIESTADRLNAKGIDADSMPVRELLAIARDDCVEG